MRDPKRIDAMLTLLKEIWQKKPDMRFFQLIYNLQCAYLQQNCNDCEHPARLEHVNQSVLHDCFYIEDDEILGFLQQLQKIDEDGK